jgi:glutamate--cysteine ligase
VRIGSLIADLTAPIEVVTRQARSCCSSPSSARQPRGRRRLRPLRGAAEQRPVRGHPADPARHRAAVVPPLVAGWSTRRKSHHFHVYDRVAEDFAKLLGIDPWLLNPRSASAAR